MNANDASSTPQFEETVYVAFLKDLDVAVDPDLVIRDYAERYPDLADELREMAKIQRKLDQTETTEHVRGNPRNWAIFGSSARSRKEGWELSTRRSRSRWVDRLPSRRSGAPGQSLDRGTSRSVPAARVLARLHHTHIVPIHAAGKADFGTSPCHTSTERPSTTSSAPRDFTNRPRTAVRRRPQLSPR